MRYVFRNVDQKGKIGHSLHKNSIGRLVKELVRNGRISNPEDYGGHSLRAGFVTEASANGATDSQIIKQTGHTTMLCTRRSGRRWSAAWKVIRWLTAI
jgi:integrase